MSCFLSSPLPPSLPPSLLYQKRLPRHWFWVLIFSRKWFPLAYLRLGPFDWPDKRFFAYFAYEKEMPAHSVADFCLLFCACHTCPARLVPLHSGISIVFFIFLSFGFPFLSPIPFSLCLSVVVCVDSADRFHTQILFLIQTIPRDF